MDFNVTGDVLWAWYIFCVFIKSQKHGHYLLRVLARLVNAEYEAYESNK